jgi:hypothetical protein
MSRRAPVIAALLLLLPSCGDSADGSPFDTGPAGTTTSTQAATTTALPSPSTSAAPVTTTEPETTTTTTPTTTAVSTTAGEGPGPEFGPLGGFDEYLFQDPFDPTRRFLHMEWLADREILRSRESTTEGWLALGALQSPPDIIGIADDQLLLEAWIDSYGGDIVPLATVLYTLDMDGWVADFVIDPWMMEAALLEIPAYVSVAPEGPVAVDTAVTSLDWTARTFRADVGVYDYFSGFDLVYEGVVKCVIAEPLECTALG